MADINTAYKSSPLPDNSVSVDNVFPKPLVNNNANKNNNCLPNHNPLKFTANGIDEVNHNDASREVIQRYTRTPFDIDQNKNFFKFN